MKSATIIIDRCALQHNLQRLRTVAPASRLIAIVKANAYGHGILETAKTLLEADAFGVARLEEALCLRMGGITHPIFLLEGFFDASDLKTISEQHLHVTIHNEEQLRILETVQLHEPITVWMKLDTGMHRLGVRPEKAEVFYRRLCRCRNILRPINIASHFSRANEPSCKETKRQLDIFNSFCIGKPGMRSIAASGGILLCTESHFEWVRPGIILYGISPLDRKPWGIDFGFRPVMSLVSSLITVREHKAGEPVGYGGTWISNRNTNLGVVAIGYGDGYPRSVPSGTPVLINGRIVPIVGSVTMDTLCIDLGPHSQDRVGDSVLLWGNNLPVEHIAQVTGISAYELITRMTSRVAMKFLG